MKISLLKAIIFQNGWRCGVAMLLLMGLVCLSLTSGIAQLKNQKRVTAVQLGDAAEGARVTIFSDSALSDYEAFRRGDRFYVKIPFADFVAAQPNFRGDGFEDVQVQKIGDSVIVSFKLQPGATARVDQHSNRLAVIFSATNRMSRIEDAAAVRSRLTARSPGGVGRTSFRSPERGRERDVAGPRPPDSPQASRAGAGAEVSSQSAPYDRSSQFRRTPSVENDKQPKGQSGTDPATKPDTSIIVPQSNSSSYPTTQTSTPAAAASNRPVSSGSNVPTNWNSRGQAALRWASANRLATLMAAPVLISLIIFVGSIFYRRRKKAVKAKPVKTLRAQPKYSPEVDLEDITIEESNITKPGEKQSPFDPWQTDLPTYPVSNIAPDTSKTKTVQEKRERVGRTTEPALKPVGAAISQNDWILTRPSLGPPNQYEPTEDREREVFEL